MAIFFQSMPVKTDYNDFAELLADIKANPKDFDHLGEVVEAYRKGRVAYVKYKRDGVVTTMKYWDRKKEPAPRKRVKPNTTPTQAVKLG